MFHVGQKVVYVGGGRMKFLEMIVLRFRPYPGEMPVKGRIYEIENITPRDCLELRGLSSPGDGYWCAGFAPRVFRPIVERKTDISVFTALLNPSPQKVRESIGYDLGFTAEEIGLS